MSEKDRTRPEPDDEFGSGEFPAGRAWEGPDPRRVLDAAERAALRASGRFDEYNLATGTVLPYMDDLDGRAAMWINNDARRRSEEAAVRAQERAREVTRLRALRAELGEQVSAIDRDLRLAEVEERSRRARLGALAREMKARKPRYQLGWLLSKLLAPFVARADRDDAAMSSPDAPDGDPAATVASAAELPPVSYDYQRAAGFLAFLRRIIDPRSWQGKDISRAVWVVCTLGFAGVDVSIQHQSYQLVDTPFMVWVLSAGISAILVIFPHAAGHLLRLRSMPGLHPLLRTFVGIGAFVWPATAIMSAVVRGSSLSVPSKAGQFGDQYGVADPGDKPNTMARALGLSPWVLALMFLFVILLTGLFAFLAGLAGEHPDLTAYRDAVRHRRTLAAERTAIRGQWAATAAQLHEPASPPAPPGPDPYVAKRIRALYDTAKARYRDALTIAAADPAFTEAAGRRVPTPQTPAPNGHR